MSVDVDPLVGSLLDGKYAVEEVVGAGAMGTVYRVRHVDLGTIRAVKLMKPELAKDASFAERFEREARLLEKVRHPHLVALHDFTRLASGVCYIVSEYVEGETLASLLKKGNPTPREQTLRLFSQLADGLAAAHRVGVVHRDVSPDNIMVTAAPSGLFAKVVDFGLAKDVLRGSPGLTGAGLLLGKIGYASPEQMGQMADDESVDARSDVFSLAVVLYRVLSGRLPWRSESLQSYLHDLIVRPESELALRIETDVPPSWQPLFLRALARDRDARTASMAELKEQLAEAASGRVLRPRASPARRGSLAWRGIIGASAAAAAMLLLVRRGQAPSPPPAKSTSAALVASATLAPPVATTEPTTPPTSMPQAAGPPPPRARVIASAMPPLTSEPTVLPAAPVLPADGRLALASDPEARVFIDGEERGRTPLSLALPPGRHFLRMTSIEGQTVEESIDIAPGAVVERDRRFSGFGSLAIVSDPWMEVRVDGGEPEQTPIFIKRITAAPHEIVGRRDGYRTATVSVDVVKGQTSRVRLMPEVDARSGIEQRSIPESPVDAAGR